MYDFTENFNDNTFDLNQIIDEFEQNETPTDAELSFGFDDDNN